MDKTQTNTNCQKDATVFDFYSKLKEIISEYESDLDKLDSFESNANINNSNENNNQNEIKENEEITKIVSLTLRKILFAVACELSSYFMDNVFLISKLKFQNFLDNKSFEKVLENILYKIVKQINIFSFRAIINLFETMQIGNFSNDNMIFFIKVLLTFYFGHTRTLIQLPEGANKYQYEAIFKKNYEKSLEDMKSLIKIIPLIELTQNDDENLIKTILRINDLPDSVQERPTSTISTNSSLPPVKTNRAKGINVNGSINIPSPFNNEDNKMEGSMTENFFQTELKNKMGK